MLNRWMKSRSRGIPVMAVSLALMLTIAGCGGKAQEAASQPKQEAQQASQQPAQDSVRVIEHAMGKTEVKGTPVRIVTLFQGATDAAVALGVKPVGVVDSWVEQPMYKYLRQDLDGVTHVGLETQPNLEEVSKLKPDLIIASKNRHEKVYAQLSQIAPTVTLEHVFKFKDTVRVMGQAMNKEDQAAKLLADWEKRVGDFKGKIDQKLGDKWPMEVAVLNFRADHARIYAGGYAPDILAELGFKFPEYQAKERAAGKTAIQLTSKESIPSMNAGTFFVFKFDDAGDAAVQKLFEEWTGHPLWKSLDAVKNNRVYMVNEVFWNNAGGIISANTMLDEIYERFELTK